MKTILITGTNGMLGSHLTKIKLLYVGRIRVEKGIFFLLEIMKKIKDDVILSVVGMEKFSDKNIEQKNAKFQVLS